VLVLVDQATKYWPTLDPFVSEIRNRRGSGHGGRRCSARYTRRTDNSDRILHALSDPGDEDPGDGAAAVVRAV
jgi:hypothetical protein